MLPRHTIALNSNLIWLTGGVARALRAALNAPTRVALTAHNGLPSASTQLILWPQLVRSFDLSVTTWWTLLAQIAILIITTTGTKQHASASATGVPATVYVHPKVRHDSRTYVTNRSRSRAMPLLFIFMLLSVPTAKADSRSVIRRCKQSRSRSQLSPALVSHATPSAATTNHSNLQNSNGWREAMAEPGHVNTLNIRPSLPRTSDADRASYAQTRRPDRVGVNLHDGGARRYLHARAPAVDGSKSPSRIRHRSLSGAHRPRGALTV